MKKVCWMMDGFAVSNVGFEKIIDDEFVDIGVVDNRENGCSRKVKCGKMNVLLSQLLLLMNFL